MGDNRNTCLLTDESGFAKQGKGSVGVCRQWLGRFGEADNGQVAVFGALAYKAYLAPVNVRFYLPQEWTDDPKLCELAGIPKDEQKFHTKPELALNIVKHARENGLNYGWVGTDAEWPIIRLEIGVPGIIIWPCDDVNAVYAF